MQKIGRKLSALVLICGIVVTSYVNISANYLEVVDTYKYDFDRYTGKEHNFHDHTWKLVEQGSKILSWTDTKDSSRWNYVRYLRTFRYGKN